MSYEGRRQRKKLIAVSLVLLIAAAGLAGFGYYWLGGPSWQSPGSAGFVTAQASIGTSIVKSCSAATTCRSVGIATSAYTTVAVMIEAETAAAAAPSALAGTPAITLNLIGDKANGTKGTDAMAYIYSADNVTAAASQTVYVNFTASTTYAFEVLDLKSPYTISKDAIGAGSTGSASKAISTTVTTVTANDLVLMDAAANVNGTIALNGDTLSASTHVGTLTAGLFSAVDASTGSFTIAGTLGSSSTWAAIAIGIKYAGVPAAPTSLATGTITTTTVPLTWVRPKGPVVNYTVAQATYSANACGSYSTVHSAGAVSSYTVTGLTQGSWYCFEVSAWNSTGQGAESTAVTGVLTLGPPLAPTGLTVTAEPGSTTELQTSWTLPPGTVVNVTEYDKAASTCANGMTGVDQGLASSNLITGLTAGTQYAVTVTAWNATGQSAQSSCVTATTNALPSAGPTGLGVTATTTTSVALTWTNPSGTLVNDSVAYTTSSVCAGVGANWVGTGGVASALTVTGLAQNTKYCFWVVAWSAGGVGPKSTDINDTTLSNLPGAVTLLVESAFTTTTITLTWTNPVPSSGTVQNLTAYYGSACYSNTAYSSWTGHLSVGGALTTYQYTGLSTGTTYCMAVSAWTQNGEGPPTYINASTQYAAPAAPTSLMEVSDSRTAITVSWTNPVSPPLVNSTVYYKAASSCANGMTGVSIGVASTYQISGLVAGTQYSIQVTAWSNGGQSPDSNCIQVTTPGTAAPAPEQLTVTAVGYTWVTLSWLNPAGYTLYNNSVYVTAANGACGTWSQKLSTGGVVNNYNVTGLSA